MRFKNKSLSKRLLMVGVLVVTSFLAACGSQEPAANGDGSGGSTPTLISLGTHQPGVVYHTAGSGIAKVISDNSDVSVTTKSFAGTKPWIPLMDKGDINIGFTGYTDALFPFKGLHGHEQNKNLRMLVGGNEIPHTTMTVREDSGIDKMSDLKGKKIAHYQVDGEVMNLFMEYSLKSVGLGWDDVKQVPISDAISATDALREGRVDAILTADPNAGWALELDNAIGIKGLNLGDVDSIEQLPADFVEETQTETGLGIGVHEAGFLDGPTIIHEFNTVLLASAHLSEDVAYEITKTLWENSEKLHSFSHWLEKWSPETMFIEDPPVPYHEGAIKFFKEKGVWTEAADANHQKLMELTK
ncbi:TAXI family TRAP transporter solute-binding subunit [Bacillus sp. Marseille-P3661]|uniref:TAXI family TRAP transporter solute-binding subunit n=1 Tax=Bacillus sp. Marseille-P3661 TaxID=1936234 RepID=UPI000C846CD9|nr:TAXI family TRAP transporter solute-binding subunit [Bacillus sp. Marseille-P3661]